LKGDHTSKLKRDILLKLLLILTTIFDRHPVPSSYIPPKQKTNSVATSYQVLPSQEQLDKECLEMIDGHRYQFQSHFYNLFCKILENEANGDLKSSPLAEAQSIFGRENTMNLIEHRLQYYDGGMFGHHQLITKDLRGRDLRCNSFAYDFYIHEDYKRIIAEGSLRDGLAWRKLKRFQLLLVMIRKAMKDVSSLKVMQSAINEAVNEEIKLFESRLQKLRQHKFSIYRHQQQYWMDPDGKLWKKWEIEKYKEDLKLQAIGDDFVMAIQDLAKDFEQKFNNIVPIGPISNYQQIQKTQQIAENTTTNAAKTNKKKSSATDNVIANVDLNGNVSPAKSPSKESAKK